MNGQHFTSIKMVDEKYHLFADRITDASALDRPHKFLFSAKDNLCSIDFQTRAGSKILDGYRPPFDATPIKKMRDAGGLLVGKTNMDEFGFGTFSTNSAFGIPLNPFDTERSCGGSSGGAAGAVCSLSGHIALGVSTGGSISCPASFCGVTGLTPTYGRVSRYGLIDYGNSLDKVGLLSRSAKDIKKYLPVISGPDARDPTSCSQPPLDMKGEVRTLGIPKEALVGLDPAVKTTFDRACSVLNSMGIKTQVIDMPSLKYALSAYYVLATSEASTNLARYCGMRFGTFNDEMDQSFNDFFTMTRTRDFGTEAKRRILLGTYSRMIGLRDKYYVRALQVRRLVIMEYEKAFEEFDGILTPTMPFPSPRIADIANMKPIEMYQADFLTVPPNLAGMPHISVPCGYPGGLPVGMQVVAPQWKEGSLIDLAEHWENIFPYDFPEVSI